MSLLLTPKIGFFLNKWDQKRNSNIIPRASSETQHTFRLLWRCTHHLWETKYLCWASMVDWWSGGLFVQSLCVSFCWCHGEWSTDRLRERTGRQRKPWVCQSACATLEGMSTSARAVTLAYVYKWPLPLLPVCAFFSGCRCHRVCYLWVLISHICLSQANSQIVSPFITEDHSVSGWSRKNKNKTQWHYIPGNDSVHWKENMFLSLRNVKKICRIIHNLRSLLSVKQ